MHGRNTLDFSPETLARDASRRSYRTRKDPFEDEWPGIIEILMANNEVGAKSILDLLILESPERFNWTHLRTLQRGIRRWREHQARETAQSGSARLHAPSHGAVKHSNVLQQGTATISSASLT
jgi:hypothetical protein